MDTFWIILTGILVAACCSLLGCFLLLRKMAMVGDAISHAVLPGIVIAYLLAQNRDSLPMLMGAGVFGVLVTVLIETLHKQGKMQIDAAIGVSFTWLFAIGVILISLYAGQVDLDQDCVLYGEIAYVPLDTWNIANREIPRTVGILSILLLGIIAFIVLGYKALFVTTFDEVFAASMGISTAFWHYALMSAVSFTTVMSFEAVGAILVVAFLVGPPSIAYLLTDNLRWMLVLSLLLGILTAITGYYLAVWINGSIAGGMAAALGVEFGLVFLWAPKYGLFFQKKKKIQNMF
ncbi:MAG: metal ABC transporter permease [Microscillaceae bacterium]|nr:metal ABC transporter permease [Microscillaceae bacterium]